MKKATQLWLELASIDLETIRNIISSEILTGVVAFHAQQAIEKSLKAILEENEQEIKKSHNLNFLNKQVKEYVDLDLKVETLMLLDKLYIESRYLGHWGIFPEGKPTLMDAEDFSKIAQSTFLKVENYLSEL